MDQLISLLSKKKKELIHFLNDNKVTYVKKRNILSYDTTIWGLKVKINITLYNKMVCGIQIETFAENISKDVFYDMINKFKLYFNEIAGLPRSDNTNHPTNSIFISYDNENLRISMVGEENSFKLRVYIHSINIYFESKASFRFLLYLAGGLFWGFAMFLTMSFGQYNWINFGIWMGGGLFFALAFGVIFELVMKVNSSSKEVKYDSKYDDKFIENESKIKFDQYYNGVIFIAGRHSFRKFVAKVYINENNVYILYLKGKVK